MLSLPKLNELFLAELAAELDSLRNPQRHQQCGMQRFAFRPESSFLFLWDVALVLILLYEAVEVPLVICFQTKLPLTVGVFNFCIGVFFLCDIGQSYTGINFNRAVYLNGRLSTCHKEIAFAYLQLWYSAPRFWLDLLASFPYSWLAGDLWAEQSESPSALISLDRTPQILRLVRLFRLLRLAKLKSTVFRLEALVSSVGMSFIFMFAHLSVLVLLLAHWTACLWFMVGKSETEDSPATWVTVAYQKGVQNGSSLYVSALYWALTTMTTVGYGDIIPITRNEKIFVICAMVLASGSFAYVLGSLGGLLQRSTEESVAFRSTLLSVNRYMKQNKIPSNTSFRVRRFLEYQNEHKEDDYKAEEQLLSVLSESLRGEIYDFVNGAALKLCPVFLSIEETFVSLLSKHLERGAFSPGDVVFRQNEGGTDLYFIVSGQVAIFHNSSVIRALGPEQYFGEIAFFLTVPRCASAQCETFVQLMHLDRNHYLQSLEIFPRMKQYFSDIVRSCEEDLSRLAVYCYSCQELGHVAGKCVNTSISLRKAEHLNKWFESRKKKTKYINPAVPSETQVHRQPHRKIHIKPSFLGVVGIPFGAEEAYPSSPRLRLLVNRAEIAGEKTPARGLFLDKDDPWEKEELSDRKEAELNRFVRRTYSKILEDSDFTPPQSPLETRGNFFRKELMCPFVQEPPIVDIERYTGKPTTHAFSISYRSSESSIGRETGKKEPPQRGINMVNG